MSSPRYFSKFPTIDYALSANKAGITTRISMKNYFLRMKITDRFYQDESIYYQYYIRDGERPDQISYQEYGDEQYYWIILQTNNIVDYTNQWPISDWDLEQLVVRKYGGHSQLHQTHHYETKEVRNDEGNLLLPKGLVVGKEFIFEYLRNSDLSSSSISRPVAVSNLEYEKRLNENKAHILLLKRDLIIDYVRDYRQYLFDQPDAISEIDPTIIFT